MDRITLQFIKAHPKEIRERAMAMYVAGKRTVDIGNELQISAKTVRTWVYKLKDARERVGLQRELKPKPRPGKSGVIAPPPYHRGCNWQAGE